MLGCSKVTRCGVERTLFLEETVDEGRVSGPLFGAVIAGAFFLSSVGDSRGLFSRKGRKKNGVCDTR